MPEIQRSYDALLTELREIALLRSSAALLNWDEQTYMPPRGAEHRAAQSALLARLSHERFTSSHVGDSLAAVEGSPLVAEPDSDAAVNVREVRRDFDRARKVPASLVEELARVEVLGQQAWGAAKKKSDYPAFRPWLEKIIGLKRQEADCVGYQSDPYDALLDQFEPGETAEHVRQTFESLRGPLVELIQQIVDSPRKAPVHILERRYPLAEQEKLARETAAAFGFDFSAGRLDVSIHPFCSGIGPGDTRLTTRYDENGFGDAFYSVLHETGHGLYEQGLPAEHYGTPRGREASLGIHESQSRMWENLVGRGRAFAKYFLQRARSAFPDALTGVNAVSEEDWYFAVNDVHPSLIRTEADETTYNLHVLLRFELERALLCGDLSTADLPGAWNDKMRQYLGLTPPDDARGCLQDIHWSGGAIGYFPTYTIGNLYAAQFFEHAGDELGDLPGQFASGDFSPLLAWLRQNIHSQGSRFRAPELVRRVTGRPLSAGPLLRHLRRKASELYGVGECPTAE